MKTAPNERPTLLLVDDCMAERDLYEFVLRDHFQILTANRGADAVALAASARPDVLVLDVMMPGLTGWETCARIKTNAITADIPVILLTGVDDVDLTQHAFAVGADDVLNKPCSADRLLECVHAALKRQKTSRFADPLRRSEPAQRSWFVSPK
jgi:putative two-component system response regulator